jgi:hypothetical protein
MARLAAAAAARILNLLSPAAVHPSTRLLTARWQWQAPTDDDSVQNWRSHTAGFAGQLVSGCSCTGLHITASEASGSGMTLPV